MLRILKRRLDPCERLDRLVIERRGWKLVGEMIVRGLRELNLVARLMFYFGQLMGGDERLMMFGDELLTEEEKDPNLEYRVND